VKDVIPDFSEYRLRATLTLLGRDDVLKTPRRCSKHPHGELTPEFLAHFPECEACQRA
jgi:hypothetical protein